MRVAGDVGLHDGQWVPQGLSTPEKIQYLETRLADTILPADVKLRIKRRLRRLKKIWHNHGPRFDCKQLATLARTSCASLATHYELQPFIAEATHTASALHTALAHPNHPLSRVDLRGTHARTLQPVALALRHMGLH